MTIEKFIKERYGLVIVLVMMIAYSAYFSALSIQRHNTFRTQASDMGQMDQAIWNTLHGNWLQDTRPDGRNLPRLTDHVEPIFFPVSLVFLIYDGIESLFVLQSIVIALGALAIYWIARRKLQSEWASAIFAMMYLLFPALQAANLAEFHAVTLASAPLMFAYNYGEEKAWRRYALFSFIALMVKEDIALLVMMMGLFFAFKSTVDSSQSADKRFVIRFLRFTFYVQPVPLIGAIISIAWFAFTLFVIIPNFSPRGESVYTERYYPGLSRDPMKLITALPPLIANVFIPDKINYVLGLLASVGFLALFDPIALMVGAPSFLLNLFSNYYAQYSGSYHYSAPVAPYFVLAAIGGAARIRNSKFGILNSKSQSPTSNRQSLISNLLIVFAFAIAMIYQLIAGYTPIGGEYSWLQPTAHDQLFARFASQIPPGVPVSTTSSLFPHLSHRLKLYRFPTILDADYILLDVSRSNTTNPIDFRSKYLGALDQGFGIRDAVDGYILLQRGLAQKELPDGFYNFLRGCRCIMPQEPMKIDFDDKIRFLGYDVKQDDWGRVYLRTYWTPLPGMDKNNYALYIFFADQNNAPRDDAQIPPLLVHFWYPTIRWQQDEVIVGETVPLDIGTGAKIGVGMFFGATFENPEFRLMPRTNDAPIMDDGAWVDVGTLVRDGKKYRVAR
jgi:uncharacterized membrane protein